MTEGKYFYAIINVKNYYLSLDLKKIHNKHWKNPNEIKLFFYNLLSNRGDGLIYAHGRDKQHVTFLLSIYFYDLQNYPPVLSLFNFIYVYVWRLVQHVGFIQSVLLKKTAALANKH